MKKYFKLWLGYGLALGVLIFVSQSLGQTQVFNRYSNFDPPDLPLAVAEIANNAVLNSQLDSQLETIALEQASNFSLKGKYKSGKYNLAGITVELHEYLTPKHEAGYQVVFRAIARNIPISRSAGYGPEAQERTWNWR